MHILYDFLLNDFKIHFYFTPRLTSLGIQDIFTCLLAMHWNRALFMPDGGCVCGHRDRRKVAQSRGQHQQQQQDDGDGDNPDHYYTLKSSNGSVHSFKLVDHGEPMVFMPMV